MISSLETKILGAIVFIVLALVFIPNYDGLKEKLGFDTVASLTREKTELKGIKEQLEEVNKENAELTRRNVALETQKRSLEEQILSKDKAAQASVECILRQRDAGLAALKSKPITQPGKKTVTTDTEVIVDTAVVNAHAEANINALWASYNELKG